MYRLCGILRIDEVARVVQKTSYLFAFYWLVDEIVRLPKKRPPLRYLFGFVTFIARFAIAERRRHWQSRTNSGHERPRRAAAVRLQVVRLRPEIPASRIPLGGSLLRGLSAERPGNLMRATIPRRRRARETARLRPPELLGNRYVDCDRNLFLYALCTLCLVRRG